MFKSIDRFVLSKIEKSTQFLQRYFGIKISTIINLCACVAITCFFMDWYFTGISTPLLLVVQGIVILSLVWFIFVDSKSYQVDAETRAAQGVSNPLKIMIVGVILRLGLYFFSVLQIVGPIFSDISTPELINLIYTFSFCMYTCALSVDVLPPSDSKVGSWFKNLFRRKSLST